MNQTNRASNRIDKINRTTIGHVNAETYSRLISDDSVAIRETFVRQDRHIHDGDFFSMDLLRGDERRRGELMFRANLAVNVIKPGKRLSFVVRHLDAGNAQRETVNDLWERAQRREIFDRKLSFAHLL